MYPKNINNITIVGDGSWGTTLAVYLARHQYAVTLWGPFDDYVKKVRQTRINSKFLPGITIPGNVKITSNIQLAMDFGECIVLAVPSQYLKNVLKKIKNIDIQNKIFLSVVKGIDVTSLQRMSQLIHGQLGDVPLAVLSGPTIAREVAHQIPSTAVIAAKNRTLTRVLQKVFNSPEFRIYTNTDIIGVEWGGSLKNIIAIACGVCDGLGFGTNAKAAILSRGLAEMSRLGVALGAKKKTFAGLTGLGDLVTTCFSPNSRNRHVGQQLGQGKPIKEILATMNMVAEGVPTVKAVIKLSRKRAISMPISQEVYNIIYRNKKPLKAVKDLMRRKPKSE